MSKPAKNGDCVGKLDRSAAVEVGGYGIEFRGF